MLVRSAALPMGWSLEKFPSYGLEQLHAAFAEIVEDARSFGREYRFSGDASPCEMIRLNVGEQR